VTGLFTVTLRQAIVEPLELLAVTIWLAVAVATAAPGLAPASKRT